MHLRRQVLQEKRQGTMNGLRLDHVVVIEHEREGFSLPVREVVGEQGQHGLKFRRLWKAQQSERGSAPATPRWSRSTRWERDTSCARGRGRCSLVDNSGASGSPCVLGGACGRTVSCGAGGDGGGSGVRAAVARSVCSVPATSSRRANVRSAVLPRYFLASVPSRLR